MSPSHPFLMWELLLALFLQLLTPFPPPPHPRYLYDLFDPFSVTLYIPKSSKKLYDIQCELYKAVNTELTALEIMRPHAITLGTKSSANLQRSNSNGGYQPLTHHHKSRDCTDYYVVMSPNSRPPIIEQDSDMSGESTASEHLSMMESHHRSVEDKLDWAMGELQMVRGEVARLQTVSDHLRKFCESLQTQIRMLGSSDGGGGGGGQKMVDVDSRGPAPLPGEWEGRGREGRGRRGREGRGCEGRGCEGEGGEGREYTYIERWEFLQPDQPQTLRGGSTVS